MKLVFNKTPSFILAVSLILTPLLASAEEAELGMSVVGNSELPKALFIVPWKEAESALAPDRPVNSLIDEALQPVDPDVFRRKLHYFDLVHKND
ncbi:MAG: hypothetical protein V3V50_06775 [Gammaproteobacteria bacterium]